MLRPKNVLPDGHRTQTSSRGAAIAKRGGDRRLTTCSNDDILELGRLLHWGSGGMTVQEAYRGKTGRQETCRRQVVGAEMAGCDALERACKNNCRAFLQSREVGSAC